MAAASNSEEHAREWLVRLMRLNPFSGRGECRGKAPHKTPLMLCLLDMAESGELLARAFTRTAAVVLRFRRYGALVVDCWLNRLDLRLPFFHLADNLLLPFTYLLLPNSCKSFRGCHPLFISVIFSG